MRVVLDASVLVKWLFNDPKHEPLTSEATTLVAAVITQRMAVQPVHWLAELAAVLARKTPEKARRTLALLDALEWKSAGGIEVMQRACRLSAQLNHHLFDTLYHAVALETEEAVLITADRQYLKTARHLGRIVGLDQWVDVIR